MLNTYIQNSGLTQTIIHNNNNKRNEFNEIKWDAEYDGKQANISLDSNSNGKKKHYNVSLDNQDLANLLNVPSVNMPIDKRLHMDFVAQKVKKEPIVLQIELPDLKTPQLIPRQPYVIKEPESMFENDVTSLESFLESANPTSYLSSPASNEELIVPITIDEKTSENYTLKPKKHHKDKKTHKTYKVYKKRKSPKSKKSKKSSKTSKKFTFF
jgi:hypothetical protein